jgi:hypothetical protein
MTSTESDTATSRNGRPQPAPARGRMRSVYFEDGDDMVPVQFYGCPGIKYSHDNGEHVLHWKSVFLWSGPDLPTANDRAAITRKVQELNSGGGPMQPKARALDAPTLLPTPTREERPRSPSLPDIPPKARRFCPTMLDDVQPPVGPTCLIDGLLPIRGLAFVVGLPKSGKSYFTQYMMASVARGVPYGGRAVVGGTVVYITGEGVTGFKLRVVVMREHLQLDGQGVPFGLIEQMPDLGSDETDLSALLADLDRFIKAHNLPPVRAVVLDTMARCMGGGDENSAKDMGRFINRCGEIERHFECCVVVVHHLGKNPHAGGRGSNAQNGAADVTIEIVKSKGYSTATVVEMKDGPEGQQWRFRLKPRDGSATFADPPATTVCVLEMMSDPSTPQLSATNSERAPKGVAGELMKVIERAIKEAGETVPDLGGEVRGVSRSNLRKYCATMKFQAGRKASSQRAIITNKLKALRAAGRYDYNKDWLWPT